MKPRPTSRDIAHAAGVSQATVSRALRNSPLVRPETRERVLEIARQLNYRVDRSAAGLRTRQSRTVALLLFEDITTDTSHINPFFLSLVSSITRAAAAREYDVLISFQQLSRDWVARYEASNRADGIILLGYGDYRHFEQRPTDLTEAGAHFVLWGPSSALSHSVGCDNVSGGRKATAHLLDLGRRQVAFLGDRSGESPEFQGRYEGYLAVLEAAGFYASPQLVATADSQVESGYAGMQKLLSRGVDIDGVFAASDLIAIGAIHALRDAGQSVPGDVSVVGFDDIPSAAYARPALTTVHQDLERAGEELVRQLITLIEGGSCQSVTIEPQLVVRDSCGADGPGIVPR